MYRSFSSDAVAADVVKPAYKLVLVVEDPELRDLYKTGPRDNENAGYDLYTAEDWKDGAVHLLSLGTKAMMVEMTTKEAVHYWLAPRSSIFKTGYMMANSMGVIDKSYRGELKAPVVPYASSLGPAGFRRGERHFQILAPDMGWIQEVEIVESLPESARGIGGFGSTGRRFF